MVKGERIGITAKYVNREAAHQRGTATNRLYRHFDATYIHAYDYGELSLARKRSTFTARHIFRRSRRIAKVRGRKRNEEYLVTQLGHGVVLLKM